MYKISAIVLEHITIRNKQVVSKVGLLKIVQVSLFWYIILVRNHSKLLFFGIFVFDISKDWEDYVIIAPE